jgi:putative FmdB family regulatory protein
VPTYQYACTTCGHQLEAVQSFTDAALTQCPECDGKLRKLFGAVGIVFKGSGFYRTDSRNGSSASAQAPSSSSAAGSSSDSPSSSSPSSSASSSSSDGEKASSSSSGGEKASSASSSAGSSGEKVA